MQAMWVLAPAGVVLLAHPPTKPTPAHVGRDAHQVSCGQQLRPVCGGKAASAGIGAGVGVCQAEQGGETLGGGVQDEFHGDGSDGVVVGDAIIAVERLMG